jgi:hypothetical protein
MKLKEFFKFDVFTNIERKTFTLCTYNPPGFDLATPSAPKRRRYHNIDHASRAEVNL